MKIIISPAKKMKEDTDTIEISGLPVFMDKTEIVKDYLQSLSYDELKGLWGVSDKIARENFERLGDMDLYQRLTPAVIAYDGIAFTYMAPSVFEYDQFNYVQEHLRILSGFYGVVKPLEGVTAYRLEMQTKATPAGSKNLYDFWGKEIYDEVTDESGVIINLASKEYSKTIEKYLKPEDKFITCIFGEIVKGKVAQKGVYAKMARGEMVRFMAENAIEDPEEIKKFDRLGYVYSEELSGPEEFVFIKK